jgi:valyl-tRNA synthetase
LIEPQIKEQWFLKMKPLAAPAIKAIKKEEIRFIPGHYKKIALHWLNNILDWPLSRQIAWGIPIPGDESHDTFDTWFSSGQWPYASLGFPKSKDFKTFFPTDVMETGGDLIFFWISRMIMLSLYNTKKIPFKNVYLHGLVMDAKGQKMSKSKGNVINPLDLTEKFGTDALRMALVVGNTPGTSLPLDENKIKGYRNFATKIWNASRFVLMNLDGYKPNNKIIFGAKDKKIIKDFQKQAKEITKEMDDFKFYSASEKIYHYFWHVFCDKIIEEQKPHLYGKNIKEKMRSQYLLLTILSESLKLLHPFMPFITEEIYQQLPLKNKKKCIMIESWTII